MKEKMYVTRPGWTPDLLMQDAFDSPVDDIITQLKANRELREKQYGAQRRPIRQSFIDLANSNLEPMF